MPVPLLRMLARARRRKDLPRYLQREELRHVLEPELLREGNRVELLRRGDEAFPAMLAAIAGARSHVNLETYILRSDATGERFKTALIERARAGVRVRLLFDSVGSFNVVSESFLSELVDAGVEVVEFQPLTSSRRKLLLKLRSLQRAVAAKLGHPVRQRPPGEPSHWRFYRRDHQKILVVDDRLAFTGGINIGDEYGSGPGGGWHDLQVRVEGPAAAGLARAFRRAWLKGGGDPYPKPPRVPNVGKELAPMLVHTIDNFARTERGRFAAAYRFALRRAQQSVAIMNAYFIPDWITVLTMQRAARRGCAVRVIVPAHSDVKLVGYASRYLYARLLRSGVRVFEYQGRMMHAKATVIDGRWATIGSFNLDRRSMVHNLEAGVAVADAEFAGSLEREFEATLAECREVQPDEWRRRGWVQRFAEWFAHLFAYWL